MAVTTRDRILAAARDLFLEAGGKGVTMRAVAAGVGLTPMALYRHFKGREALLEAVVEQGHAVFLGYLQRALAEPTAVARLARSGDEYLRFALEHPRDYAVMFMEALQIEGKGVPEKRQPLWRDVATFRFLVDRVRECAADGALQVGDPEDTALTLWAHVHGLMSLYLAGKLHLDEKAFRSLYRRSLAYLTRGLDGTAAAPAKRRAAIRG
jgi:AcrR family transcriptional regulator